MKLEDLKVGQYVRFKDKRGNAYIRNIKEVCNEQPHKSWGAIIIDKNANNVPYVYLKHIKKASYNIIDILEENDYVNGLRVEKNKYGELYTSYVYYGGDIGKQCEVYTTWLKELEEDMIYSIVTHEQMEQMTYKVGD